MLHKYALACICISMFSQSHHTCHHFVTNLCMRLPYTAAAFPWWSSGPPFTFAAWGQREPWVQLAALAATRCFAPWSGGQNPRKLCQLGARIEGTGSSAVGSGWHVGWDETTTRLCSKQTSLESNIVICMSCKFVFICLLKLVPNLVHLRQLSFTLTCKYLRSLQHKTLRSVGFVPTRGCWMHRLQL